jgi:hypothetical protein
LTAAGASLRDLFQPGKALFPDDLALVDGTKHGLSWGEPYEDRPRRIARHTAGMSA